MQQRRAYLWAYAPSEFEQTCASFSRLHASRCRSITSGRISSAWWPC